MKALTERSLRQLLRDLDRRQRELRRLVAEERALIEADDVSHLQDPASDDIDRADARSRVALEDRMIDRQLAEMAEVAAACERIDNDTFGLCVDCGENIEYDRLKALPAAPRCMACQSRHERPLGR